MTMFYEQYDAMKYDVDREYYSGRRTLNERTMTGLRLRVEHWGHIECHCSEKKNQTLKETLASLASRVTHSDQCHWTCCDRKWNMLLCSGDDPRKRK